MCGIAGYYSKDGIDQNALNEMCDILQHRGPNDKGTWKNEHIGLAHTRLSILDLSVNGKQPMVSASGRYILIFNGEIYNHLDLRKSINIDWKGSSDTETLLESLEYYGVEETLNNLEGMFAFAFYDKINNTVTIIRDPIGQKPLYYGWLDNKFCFASELKAIKTISKDNLVVDRESLSIFIKTGYIPAPKSIYKNIFKLKPGHYAVVNLSKNNDVNLIQYYDLKKIIESKKSNLQNNSDHFNKNELKKVLMQSIKRQQISDVPIGTFLSGGIDSSLISSMMQESSSSQIDTFTIGFGDKRFDESEYAKKISSIIGTRHNEIIVNYKEIQDTISLVPRIYDEPFADSSQLVTFLLSKFAKNNVTVALSGDGGDELFGGYNRYKWATKILSIPYPIRYMISFLLNGISQNVFSNIENLSANIGIVQNNYQLSDKINKLSYLLKKKNFEDLYQNLLFNYIDNYEDDVVLNLSTKVDLISSHDMPANLANINEKMMYLDTLIYLPDDILCKVDRASMSVGLETRIPFLDKDVIEFAWKLPFNQKIKNGKTKYILRDLLEDYLPRELIDRPKMGFSVPISSWLRGPLKKYANEKINDAINSKEKYFDSQKVLKKWNEHLSGKKNWHYFIWNIIVFQSWLEYNS
tara:strand:+ start:137 stop:2050 length:1914 start_codon:yes stop_codon:yes gene_type:complete